MATSTTRVGLLRPEATDTTNWDDIYPPTLDDIDDALGAQVYTASTMPASSWSGKQIYNSTYKAEETHDGSGWVFTSVPAASTLQGTVTGTHNGCLGVQTSDMTVKTWVASSSTWNDPRPQAQTPLATYVASGTQSCANNTDVYALFDGTAEFTSTFVTKTTAASGSGGGSVFTMNVTGTYVITAQAVWASSTGGRREIHIVDSTNSNNRWGSTNVDCSNNPLATPNLTAIRRFTAGDAVKIMVNQNSGGALDLEVKAWGVKPRISIAWIGA